MARTPGQSQHEAPPTPRRQLAGGVALFVFTDGKLATKRVNRATSRVLMRPRHAVGAEGLGRTELEPRIFRRVDSDSLDALVYREDVSSPAGEGAARLGKAG